MPVVDIVVAVALVLGALHGLRVGALVQVFTFGGSFVGLVAGALLASAVAPHLNSPAAQAGAVLALLLGLALLGGALARILGARAAASLRRHHLGPLDAGLGVVVAVVAVLVTAWILGSILAESRFSAVSGAIQRSAILRQVDRVLPPVPSLFSRVQAFLSSAGFPAVFAGLVPELEAPVPVPGRAQAEGIGGPIAASTAKVLGAACGQEQEGTAFSVAPGVVVTNAHVVAGEARTEVVVADIAYPATTVFFDPAYDLAVLRTAAPLGPPLTLAPALVERGTQAAMVGFPENGGLTVTPAAVAGTIEATGRTIYGDGEVVRTVYQIEANVEPGNSGSPLVDAQGSVVGVVFSRSTAQADVGYALSSPGVLKRVAMAEGLTTAVSTGSCVTG